LTLTWPATALKVAEVCPEATVTLEGTVRFALFEESATASPAAGAADVRATVQGVLPPATTVAEAQLKPLNVGRASAMAPPVLLAGIESPAAVDATMLVIWMEIFWAAFGAIWKVAVATIPSAITF